MEWLTQNWIFVAAAVGIFLLMRRGGMGCGAGGGHHGGTNHHSHQGGHGDGSSAGPVEQAIDPVSGKPVDTSRAVTALYRGAPVYFESRENRERFEAAPEQFPITEAAPPRQRRHGGC